MSFSDKISAGAFMDVIQLYYVIIVTRKSVQITPRVSTLTINGVVLRPRAQPALLSNIINKSILMIDFRIDFSNPMLHNYKSTTRENSYYSFTI